MNIRKKNFILEEKAEGVIYKNLTILYVSKDFWIASRGYSLYRYDVANDNWIQFSKIADSKNAVLSSFFLTRRFFRAEIRNLYHFSDDNWMCIARKGIFKLNKESGLFEKCYSIERGSRPMNMCQDSNDDIYFGDYYFNPQRKAMHIHKSTDGGNTWTVAYTFQDGEVNHIHGLFFDKYSNRLWVATGDDDCGCIFGYTEDSFKSFVRVYQGKQEYRICVPMFFKDKIVYATDSQYAKNEIRSIDRITGTISKLADIQGSGIYAASTNAFYLVSTTIEPSQVNIDKHSYLWFSKDGETWSNMLCLEKDIWHNVYFQFGSIRFPYFEKDATERIIISGRAIKKIGGSSLVIDL